MDINTIQCMQAVGYMQASHLGVKAGRIQRAGRQREVAQRMADLQAAPLLCESAQLAS